ncbi:TPA: hypothetical protein ROA41_002573 [Escherichia coli]|uniref:hypothetical protein n=1 Tax=Leclercia sp. W6 TaxID=2282310 RepID=UPI000DF2B9AD|nr:hypothetical protein [Leclercia sp. W6]AXF59338.1 hypothetical protein DVA43_07160 [Leclercia sp. W6]HDX3042579.1 hypothetical protein [Escherichia coli]
MYADDTKQQRLTDALIIQHIEQLRMVADRFYRDDPALHAIVLADFLSKVHEELCLRADDKLELSLPEGLPDFRAPVTSAYDVDDWPEEGF